MYHFKMKCFKVTLCTDAVFKVLSISCPETLSSDNIGKLLISLKTVIFFTGLWEYNFGFDSKGNCKFKSVLVTSSRECQFVGKDDPQNPRT